MSNTVMPKNSKMPTISTDGHFIWCTRGEPGYSYAGDVNAHDECCRKGGNPDDYGAYCPKCGTFVWGLAEKEYNPY